MAGASAIGFALAAWLAAPWHAPGSGRPISIAIFDCSASVERTRPDLEVWMQSTAEEQRARISRRAGMTEERAAALLARQMPDAEKRQRAHFIIDSSGDYAATRKQVADIMRAVAGMAAGK